MNKIFALILFIVGIGFMIASTCANPITTYLTPDAPLLSLWGIIWRVGLGLLLIVVGILLNNVDSFNNEDPLD